MKLRVFLPLIVLLLCTTVVLAQSNTTRQPADVELAAIKASFDIFTPTAMMKEAVFEARTRKVLSPACLKAAKLVARGQPKAECTHAGHNVTITMVDDIIDFSFKTLKGTDGKMYDALMYLMENIVLTEKEGILFTLRDGQTPFMVNNLEAACKLGSWKSTCTKFGLPVQKLPDEFSLRVVLMSGALGKVLTRRDAALRYHEFMTMIQREINKGSCQTGLMLKFMGKWQISCAVPKTI